MANTKIYNCRGSHSRSNIEFNLNKGGGAGFRIYGDILLQGIVYVARIYIFASFLLVSPSFSANRGCVQLDTFSGVRYVRHTVIYYWAAMPVVLNPSRDVEVLEQVALVRNFMLYRAAHTGKLLF